MSQVVNRIVFSACVALGLLAGHSTTAEADDDESSESTTKATENDFVVAILKETEAEEDRRSVATSSDDGSREFEVVRACGLGGLEVCDHAATCADGSPMYLVYVIENGVRVGDPSPRCFEDQEPPEMRQQITNAMVLRALRRVELPKPTLSIQPPGGKTLVNFETIFSTDAEPFMRTVRLLGRKVQLEITPSSYEWSYGDGTTEATAEPGVAWEKGRPMSDYLTHVYADAEVTMRPRVAVTYGARFRVHGGPWREVSGTVTSQGPAVDLRVIEAETRLLS